MLKPTARSRAADDAQRDALARGIGDILDRMRARAPRIQVVTNAVSQPLIANGLVALGANPSMTINAEEIETFVAGSQGLLINLGMLDPLRMAVIPLAAKAAREHAVPFVLDPVKAELSPRRCALAGEVLAEHPAIMKCNASEAEAFAQEAPDAMVEIVTGAVDQIRLGLRRVRLANGHPLLPRVTATGCLGGAILAACLAVENDPFLAGAAGISLLNISAEIAADGAAGPGSFAVRLIDALAALDAQSIHQRLRFEAHSDEPASEAP